MRKLIKKLISFILCALIVFSCASCKNIRDIMNGNVSDAPSDADAKNENEEVLLYNNKEDRIVPKGYTGGVESDLCFHEVYAVYWLETYDEVLAAVELLKSHGSTIKRSMAFDCEGDIFDVKFCFLYERSKAQKLEEGKDFFDRKIDDGEFIWFALYDKVSIDEMMYNNTIYHYDLMSVHGATPGYFDRDFENVDNTDELSFDWFGKTEFGYEQPIEQDYYEVTYNDSLYTMIHFSESFIPVEYHDEFLSTFVIIE